MFWVQTAVVKNKVQFFVYNSVNFGPTDKISLKSLGNFWSNEPIRSPKFEKKSPRAQIFFIKSSKNWIKRAPRSRVNCRFRRHLLSEMHNFRAIWLVSSRLLEHCQFSHLPGRIGLWRLFPFILPYIFLPYNFRTYF